MFRIKAIVLAALCLAVFTTCRKEHDRPQWDVGVLGPLVKGTLGINNLINDTLLKTNADSSVTLIYEKSLYSLTIDSLVMIPDTTITTIAPPVVGFTISIGPSVTLYQNTNETRLGISNVQLRYAIVKSGIVRFVVTNRLHTKLTFTYTIPRAILDGIPLSITRTVDSATSAGPCVFISETDLSGYIIDLTGTKGNEVNSISYYLSAITDANGPTVTIQSNDTGIIIQNSFENINPYYVKGYLGQTTLNIGPDTTLLDLFKTIKSGILDLASATMKLTIENDIGMEAILNVDSIISFNSNTNNSVPLSAPSLINKPLNINRAGSAGTNTAPSYIPAFYPLQIDNSNSNFRALLNNLPDYLIYKLNLKTNPFGNISGDYDFAFADHLVNANINLTIPMNLYASQLTMSDTTGFSLGGDATLDNLGDGSLIFNVDNGFPFAVNITLITLDSLNHYSDMLLSNATAAAPPLDVNNKAIGKQRTQFTIPVDDARFEKLRHVKSMVVTAAFTTAAAGSQRVKFYSYYSLDYKLIANLIYHVR